MAVASTVSIRYIAVLGSQLYLPHFASRFASQFPSAISRYLVPNKLTRPTQTTLSVTFPSAISRYLVPNTQSVTRKRISGGLFPSAISRYLVPNPRRLHCSPGGDRSVSIRYIAVLGSQPYQKNTPSDQQRRKRFAHPPSNRSHSHICFLKSR